MELLIINADPLGSACGPLRAALYNKLYKYSLFINSAIFMELLIINADPRDPHAAP